MPHCQGASQMHGSTRIFHSFYLVVAPIGGQAVSLCSVNRAFSAYDARLCRSVLHKTCSA